MLPMYHVGVVVENIEEAMEELTRAMWLRWEKIRDRQRGPWKFRVAYCLEGPPYIELLEGRKEPGHPFDTTNGPRLDHIGLWSDDFEADRKRLAEGGLPVQVDGATLSETPGVPHEERGGKFTLHVSRACGMRVQLTPGSSRSLLSHRLETLAQASGSE